MVLSNTYGIKIAIDRFMLATPSKYCSLDFLLRLDADHYLGASGQEYCEEEVNELKWQKLQAMADKQTKKEIKQCHIFTDQ